MTVSSHRRARSLLASLLAILFSLPLVLLLPCTASGQDRYLRELEQTALQQELYRERTWEVLLHYTRPLTGGTKSRIDDRSFFLAPDGRIDPQAELVADLRALFAPPGKDGEYFACRFPARFAWLSGRLDIDAARLPAYSCAERDKARAAVEPESAVLVFPVGHINSPASMFGHTLIRIDGSSTSKLISYAANYAAATTDTNGFVYAFKGLFGGYRGYYSILPYYLKVKEYNDLEHRDMWEYRLRLSREEVVRMMDHIWELQNIGSSYYFLDENCSYNLLFLIEAARPELRLVEQTGMLVLPTQTIGIVRASGIVDPPTYRPSQGTRIRKVIARLDDGARKQSRDLAYGTLAPSSLASSSRSRDEQIAVLDAAVEFLQFRLARKELAQEEFTRSYLRLLARRSTLGEAPQGGSGLREPARPETGHRAATVAAGLGVRRGEPYARVEFQPVLHNLLDPDQGYLRGAQIRFFGTSLDYRLPDAGFRLRSLRLLDILSLTPRDVFFKPLSWKVNTGLDTEILANGGDYLVYRLNTGGGLAGETPFGGIWYALGEIDVNAGAKLRGTAALGPGLSAGLIEQLTEWWKLHLWGAGYWYRLGDDRYSVKGALEQNFRLSQNNSLNLKYTLALVNRHRVGDASFVWNYYF